MNRNEEYRLLLEELAQMPPELDETMERARTRLQQDNRKRRRLWRFAGSFAACFTGFVLLVNLFPPFARACSDIPILSSLAEAVKLSPSLHAAVENEYVQPIGQSQTINGITATVEYVIVDLKQVNVFFTLEGEGYETLSGEMPEIHGDQECSTICSDFGQPPGTLLDFTLDYFENDVPDEITFTMAVTTWDHLERDAESAPDRTYADDLLAPVEEPEEEILAEFTFTVKFDPTFTQQGRTIAVEQSFAMAGQTLTVTDVEVYPTHARVNLEDAPENTTWLKTLKFYLENEDGHRFEPVSNGVSATGDEDSPMNVSFRFDSPYFADSEHLTLKITGAEWLDKDWEWIRLDLISVSAEHLPEGVAFTKADHRSDGWYLEFESEYTEGEPHRQLWYMTFRDSDGQEYEMGRMGTTTGDSGRDTTMIPLPDYHADEVWLRPTYTRESKLDAPISIPIN